MFRVLVAIALVSSALAITGCTGSLRLGSYAQPTVVTAMFG